MAKIPFSIEHREKIESGEYKVEMRDGRTARIICWDRKDNNYPIIALFEEYGKECLLSYTQNGQHLIGKSNVSDLFLVTPEPEMSEFEKKLSDVFGYAISMSVSDPQKPTDEFVREYAPELLAIARKELYTTIKRELEENPNGWVQRVEDAHNSGLKAGYKNGRAEALKDLPRWREWDNGAAGNSEGHPIALVSGACGIRFVSVLGVTGEKYIMLDDLKKLPGFKED